MNCDGAIRVSRTRRLIGSEARRRRGRCMGNAMLDAAFSVTNGFCRTMACMGQHRDHVARRWFVAGRVQGVGFRYFVQEKATALGLRGFVRNLEDGRVEVYATGPEGKLSDLAAALHVGPHMADVRTVDEQEEAVNQFPRFFVR